MTSKIIVAIIVLGALGFGIYSMKKDTRPVDDAVAGQEEVIEEDGQTSTGKKMAFSVFLEQDKGSYQCTVKQYLDETNSQGTVYLNNGAVRGDFVTKSGTSKEVKASFIIKDGYQYVWTSPLASGFKMKMNSISGSSDSSMGMAGTYGWNAEQIGDYECTPWTADTATFALPSGIMFAEIAQPAPQLE